MRKKILFLEKVIETTSILPELSSNSGTFDIDAIASIEEAVKLVKKNNYDLIYINIYFLDMRIVTLFEILIDKNYFGHLIFSGDYKNPQVIKKMGYFKSLDVLIKPFDSKWLKNTIINHLKTGKSIGNDSNKILSQFFIFKLIDFEKGSITLKINFDGKKGLIVFENGVVVYAKFSNKEGTTAIKEIIETDIPFNKKGIWVSNPGFFIKKDANINLSSILETYGSSGIIKDADQSIASSDSELISYMIEKMMLFCNKDVRKVIEDTIIEMGFTMTTLPSDEEIDLIVNVSKKIDKPEKSTAFKQCMVNFLITKEKNC